MRSSKIPVLAVALVLSGVAHAQTYPSKPIRMYAAEAGGGGDFVARLVAKGLSGRLGQSIVVENQGAASGAIAAQAVARAAPDGHTLLFYASTMWILPLLKEGVPYEPLRDFSPITLAATAPNILVVHPGVPAQSVKELIALAKNKPGVLNYGVGGSGSSTHLAAELFKAMADIDVVRVNYKGTGPALTDLMGGRLQMMFATMGAMTQVKAGKLRALAVTSAQPSALLPDLPTVTGSGVPGYESATTYGFFAPAKTPSAVVNQLSAETIRVLQSDEIRPALLQAGVEPVGNSPAQFAAMVKSDMAKWGKVIKSAGITAD